jgi:hypothetical protein
VLKDRQLAAKLGAAARASIVDVFDAMHTTRRLKVMFEEALSAQERVR